ncbi:hypothetical protein pdam_00017378 [Pocillopora damicornis]|uniref:Uncharacterized protein n=1 Tax=Pocillopora damicornis TaxID=46731 RepID=A0A3M6UKD3_POCDA|nr:hypothetical protein pdam_00017378 [Pocillopora damicornis]
MGTSRLTGRLEQTVEVTCKRYTSQEGEEAVLLFTPKIWITSTDRVSNRLATSEWDGGFVDVSLTLDVLSVSFDLKARAL